MSEIIQTPKMCPGCRALTPMNQMKKVASRSSGKIYSTWRCFACIKRKQIALKATKDRTK